MAHLNGGAQSPRRGLRKNRGFAAQHPGFCAESAQNSFLRLSAKINSFSWRSATPPKTSKIPSLQKKEEIRSAQSAQENMHRREAFAPASCASPPPQTRANRFFTTTLLLTTHAAASLRRFVLYLHKKSIFVLQVATNDLRVMLIRVAVAVCR